MAYSSAEISSSDRTLLANDKPILGANALVSGADIDWRTSGSFASGSDIAESSYPTSRVYDGKTHIRTRPNATSSDIYLIIDAGSAGIEFDFLGLVGHNFGDSATNVTYTLQIADNNAFSSNLVTLSTSTFIVGSGNSRIVDLSLFHTGSVALRYSSVRYVRLRLQTLTAYKFEIGEFILGRRRQLKHAPNVPWDDYGLGSVSEFASSLSGVITKYSRHHGGRTMRAEFNPHETAYIDDLQSWWEQIDHGTKSFIWIDKPNTSPGDFHLMHIDGSTPMLGMPIIGPSERNVMIQATEQGPDYVAVE